MYFNYDDCFCRLAVWSAAVLSSQLQNMKGKMAYRTTTLTVPCKFNSQYVVRKIEATLIDVTERGEAPMEPGSDLNGER